MGVIIPKVINHEQRKLDLMRATVQTCYNQGFSNLNIGDVASAIGVTRTLFYTCFPDKASIVDYALDYAIEVVGRDYERLCENAFLSSTEKIFRIFERLLTDVVRERQTMSVFIDILLDRSAELSRQRRRIHRWMFTIRQHFMRILRSGIDRKELVPLQVKPMATTLLMLLISSVTALVTSKSSIGSSLMKSVGVLLQGMCCDEKVFVDVNTVSGESI